MKITKTFDLIIIAFTLVGAIAIFGYARPLIISPLTDITTTNNSVLFAFDRADTIIIDKNPDFSNPLYEIHAKNNIVVSLKPGVYYWKIKGLRESIVHNITILSAIDLRVKSVGNNYQLTNAGNVPLNVEVYNKSVLQGNVILAIDEQKNASGTLFLGRENASN